MSLALACGRRGHRAVSIGVHAGRRSAGHGRRGRAVPRLPAARRTDGAAAGDDPHLRHRRASARAAAGRCGARRAVVPRCSERTRACRPARHPVRPRAAGDLQDAAARAAARGARTARCAIMFPFVSSVQEVRTARALLEEARAELDARGIERAARAGRHHDRSAVGGLHGVAAGARGRLLHHRHQRSHPVHAGGRSHRRARVGSLRAAAPGGAAPASAGASRRGAAGHSGVRVRRDGVGSAAAAAADRMRPDRVQHDAGRAADGAPRRPGDERRRDGAHRGARADARHGRGDRADVSWATVVSPKRRREGGANEVGTP